MQNLAIEFGSGGNKRVCPMAKASEWQIVCVFALSFVIVFVFLI